MSKPSLRVAVAGLGLCETVHLEALRASPLWEPVALWHPRAERLERACARHQLPGTDDFAALVADPGLDAVVIATPPGPRHGLACLALEAGKHLMLEKAMANTLPDLRDIRDAAADSGVKSVVSFVLRWNPLFEIIKAQLAAESIGRVFYGEVDYFHGIGPWYGQYGWNVKKEIGGSSLLSAGCHAMDALRWFMGGEVAEVTQYATQGKGHDFKDYEYNPTSVTVLKFADGRIGKVASCIECIQPYVFNINLVGTEGAIKNNKLYSRRAFPGQTSWPEVPTILPDSGDVTHHPFQQEVDHLVDCILNNKESHVNVADAYKTHEIILAADRSGREGVPVKLPLT